MTCGARTAGRIPKRLGLIPPRRIPNKPWLLRLRARCWMRARVPACARGGVCLHRGEKEAEVVLTNGEEEAEARCSGGRRRRRRQELGDDDPRLQGLLPGTRREQEVRWRRSRGRWASEASKTAARSSFRYRPWWLEGGGNREKKTTRGEGRKAAAAAAGSGEARVSRRGPGALLVEGERGRCGGAPRGG